jgi:hypothetical protein
VDKQWLRDTAAYLHGLSESAGSPFSWFSGHGTPTQVRRSYFCTPMACGMPASCCACEVLNRQLGMCVCRMCVCSVDWPQHVAGRWVCSQVLQGGLLYDAVDACCCAGC